MNVKTNIPDDLRELMNMFLKLFQKYSLLIKEPKALLNGEVLHAREMETIMTIGLNPEISNVQLTEKMGVTKGAVSQLLSRLIKKQFVAKFKDPLNSKFNNIRLTDKGYFAFNEVMKRREDALNEYNILFQNASERDIEVVKIIITNIEKDLNKLLGIV